MKPDPRLVSGEETSSPPLTRISFRHVSTGISSGMQWGNMASAKNSPDIFRKGIVIGQESDTVKKERLVAISIATR